MGQKDDSLLVLTTGLPGTGKSTMAEVVDAALGRPCSGTTG